MANPIKRHFQKKKAEKQAINAYNRRADRMNWEYKHGTHDYYSPPDASEVYRVRKDQGVKSWQEAKKVGTTHKFGNEMVYSSNNPYNPKPKKVSTHPSSPHSAANSRNVKSTTRTMGRVRKKR